MTAIQICALIDLFTLAALLVRAGYFMGHSDDVPRAESAKTIRELRAKLDYTLAYRHRLLQRCKQKDQDSHLGESDRQTLLDIVAKLRIAAEIFAALRTGKKPERETTAWRELALAIGCPLKAASEGEAE